jgi:hypothetical protein
VSGYELLEDSTPFDDSTSKSIAVDCPPGKKPIGGGGGIFLFTPGLALRASIPTETGWQTTAARSSSGSGIWLLDVKLSCAPAVEVERFTASASRLGANLGHLALTCPSSRRAIGGGGRVVSDSSLTPVAMYEMRPSIALGGWGLGGRRIGGSANWRLDVAVLCHLRSIFADGFESGDVGAWPTAAP